MTLSFATVLSRLTFLYVGIWRSMVLLMKGVSFLAHEPSVCIGHYSTSGKRVLCRGDFWWVRVFSARFMIMWFVRIRSVSIRGS